MENYTFSWAKTITADTEARCPNGQDTVWIHCGDETVTNVEALQALKDLLVKENADETTTVIVMGEDNIQFDEDEDVSAYCERESWTYNCSGINGSESEVNSK